jgi:hypothetical protein
MEIPIFYSLDHEGSSQNLPATITNLSEEEGQITFAIVPNENSSGPNAYWRTNYENKTFEFVSLKTINPEEEIFVFYGDDSYWNDGRTHTEII